MKKMSVPQARWLNHIIILNYEPHVAPYTKGSLDIDIINIQTKQVKQHLVITINLQV